MNNISTFQDLQQAQQSPIEYITFSGGGAKGAIYSGVYSAIKSAGIFDGVKAVAGSSAGALTAAITATGTSAERFQEISKSTNFKDLLGKGGLFEDLLPLNKDGKPLYELMNSIIRENVGIFLQRQDIKSNQYLEELKRRYNEGGKIYFRDIALMQNYDPVQYKDLIITAVERDTGELTIFSSYNTPDVEIAAACHASAALPLVFNSVKIDGKSYVDGGYKDNMPTRYFRDNDPEFDVTNITEDIEEIKLAKRQGRILTMVFGSSMDDDTNIAVYSAKKFKDPSALVKFFYDVFVKIIAAIKGNFRYTDIEKETNEQLRANALNAIVLDTKGVGTVSFDLAQRNANYLDIKGYYQTIEYLNNHDLGKKPDKAFEYQNFLLNTYEIYDSKNLNKASSSQLKEVETSSRWKSKVIRSYDDNKAKTLLAFCQPGVINEENLTLKLKEYIIIAASRGRSVLSTSELSLHALIHTLNDATTKNKIKENFIDILSIDKDIRFDKNKSYDQNITAFKFTENDFKLLISQSKSTAVKVHNQYYKANNIECAPGA